MSWKPQGRRKCLGSTLAGHTPRSLSEPASPLSQPIPSPGKSPTLPVGKAGAWGMGTEDRLTLLEGNSIFLACQTPENTS